MVALEDELWKSRLGSPEELSHHRVANVAVAVSQRQDQPQRESNHVDHVEHVDGAQVGCCRSFSLSALLTSTTRAAYSETIDEDLMQTFEASIASAGRMNDVISTSIARCSSWISVSRVRVRRPARRRPLGHTSGVRAVSFPANDRPDGPA